MLFTPLADTDLEEIGDYIAQDNPARALTFIQEIRAQCQKIGKSPLAYREGPEDTGTFRAYRLRSRCRVSSDLPSEAQCIILPTELEP